MNTTTENTQLTTTLAVYLIAGMLERDGYDVLCVPGIEGDIVAGIQSDTGEIEIREDLTEDERLYTLLDLFAQRIDASDQAVYISIRGSSDETVNALVDLLKFKAEQRLDPSWQPEECA